MIKNISNIWRSIYQKVYSSSIYKYTIRNKYLKFILRVLIVEIAMLVRIMVYWKVKVHRAHARHMVYNYMLQYNKFNYYLAKSGIQLSFNNADIENHKGYVVAKNVSYIDYLLYKYLVWIWLDDSAECDTYHEVILSDILSDKELVKKYANHTICGMSYELGDRRAYDPIEYFPLEVKNIIEYKNFNLVHELFYITNIHDVFNIKIGKYMVGYKYVDTVAKKDVYRLVIEKYM